MTPVRRALLFIVHLLYGAFAVWYALPRCKPAERGVVVTSWARRALDILNVRIVWQGNAPPGAVTSTLFVCNHVSWLDILALLAVRPMRFVAKSEVRSWPMIGWMAMKTGTLFLRRNECRHLAQVKRTIESALAHGGCIATFPEATTTDGITVRPFHSGLFESAVVSGATVWPVALRYYHSDGSLSKEAAFIGDQSLISSLRRILRQPVLNLAVVRLSYRGRWMGATGTRDCGLSRCHGHAQGTGATHAPRIGLTRVDVLRGRIGGAFRPFARTCLLWRSVSDSIRKQPLTTTQVYPRLIFFSQSWLPTPHVSDERESLFSLRLPRKAYRETGMRRCGMQLSFRIDIRRYVQNG